MFFEKESKENKRIYEELLESIGRLSNLFSESESPYLDYRAAENIFCKAFKADNLSRADCSADAKKGKIGIGIKTFLNQNGKTFQKVAEFNKEAHLYKDKNVKDIVNMISFLRNERIQSTMRIYGVNEMIYHCIVREKNKIKVFETNMDEINISKIKKISSNKSSISFTDEVNEYRFNLSKSTLYKRFNTENILLEIDVDIIEDPYTVIKNLIKPKEIIYENEIVLENNSGKYSIRQENIVLPLYSIKKGEKYIPEKSGLNQWNAGGRARHCNEIYIPIPRCIHNNFPDFFPPRDTSFNLELPDGEVINAKVCQDNGKALMSNPNKKLGEWLLRQVLGLEEREILKYEKLEVLGIDSVRIYKKSDEFYSINFDSLDSYENFKEEYMKTTY